MDTMRDASGTATKDSNRIAGIALLVLLGGVVVLPTVPNLLAAQETGAVTGRVVDQADFQPVPGARVSLPDFTHVAQANAQGEFRLHNVPAGQVVMRVEADGFVTFVESVEIAPSEESLIHFHLHRIAAVLDQILVEVPRLEDRERGASEGLIVGTGASQRTAADLLMSGVPGLSVRPPQGAAGSGVMIRIRGVSSFVLNEEPHIYVDGIRIDAGGMDGAMLSLAEIPASSVTRIRVLRGPASASQFPNAAAGVILVETMRREG